MPTCDWWEEKSQFRGIGAIPTQQAARENPLAEVSPPGPGQQPQLPQKTPRIPSWVPQGKSLPLSVLLASTLSLYSMHRRVKRCFATSSFLQLLAALRAIHPSATFSPARCPSDSPHASDCRLREHAARQMPLWLNGRAAGTHGSFATTRASCNGEDVGSGIWPHPVQQHLPAFHQVSSFSPRSYRLH